MADPGPAHEQAVEHILRYLRGATTYGLFCEVQGNNLHGYCDADYAGDHDSSKSTSGYVFLEAGGAVSWRSKKQATIATSTTEAKYISSCGAN